MINGYRMNTIIYCDEHAIYVEQAQQIFWLNLLYCCVECSWLMYACIRFCGKKIMFFYVRQTRMSNNFECNMLVHMCFFITYVDFS